VVSTSQKRIDKVVSARRQLATSETVQVAVIDVFVRIRLACA